MVDKVIGNAYLWYSGATDVTGKKLAEALGMRHGDKIPTTKDVCMVIGWGTKTKDQVLLGKLPTLNHPDKISLNRNKVESLKLMEKAGVNVAPFIGTNDSETINQVGSKVVLPVIGRTNYHQGGKGFWNCPTMTHVKAAIEEGAGYFQNLIEIKDEYRLHTFNDKVIYAVKKAKRTVAEMEEAYIKQEMERQISLSTKNNEVLDQNTMEIFLRRQAKKFAQDGANMLIRSNRLGWKFIRVKTINKELEDEAIKALKAIGLNFGAVDCCIDANDKPWIIEVNSGPGLEETTFDTWVDTFRENITSILNPKSISTDKKVKIDSILATKNDDVVGEDKRSLVEKVRLMHEMVEAANNEEAIMLNKVFSKMFG
jgi:glutathione synthase/RimK-type ligase-like ATP-grasp enzyme